MDLQKFRSVGIFVYLIITILLVWWNGNWNESWRDRVIWISRYENWTEND
jgi:regulatory protein YycI of two-component signal transduction system YycFG